jgi:Pectate lyase superfamily protein
MTVPPPMQRRDQPERHMSVLDSEPSRIGFPRRQALARIGAAGGLAALAGYTAGSGSELALANGGSDGIVSVKDFGAKGNGTADDSAAIQAAISATATDGRTVYLPAGIYMIGQPVHFRDGLTLQGAGRSVTILRLMPTCNGPILETQVKGQFDDDLVVCDMTLDGDGAHSNFTGNGVALLHSYNLRRWHIARCRITGGRSYGLGLQGNESTGNGPQEDIYIADCEFEANHYGNEGTGGVDVKSSARLTMVNCVARKEAVGFDIRSHFGTFINCHARECTYGFLFRQTNNIGESTANEAYVTVLGGSGQDCDVGLTVAHNNDQSTDLGYTHVTVIGFNSRDNIHGLGTSGPTPPNIDNAIALAILGGAFTHNSGFGIAISPSRNVAINGAVCRQNDSDGIRLTDTTDAAVIGCELRDNGGRGLHMAGSGKTDRIAVAGNVLGGNFAGPFYRTSVNSKLVGNAIEQNTVIASSPTITVPEDCNLIVVTGKTNINSITGSYNQRQVTLQFADGPLTVVNGENLRLSGSFNANSFDTLTLVCADGNWYEVARSIN